jgi:hypothetical protein
MQLVYTPCSTLLTSNPEDEKVVKTTVIVCLLQDECLAQLPGYMKQWHTLPNADTKAPTVWHTAMVSMWVGALIRAAQFCPLGPRAPAPHTTCLWGNSHNHAPQQNKTSNSGGESGIQPYYFTARYRYRLRLRLPAQARTCMRRSGFAHAREDSCATRGNCGDRAPNLSHIYTQNPKIKMS